MGDLDAFVEAELARYTESGVGHPNEGQGVRGECRVRGVDRGDSLVLNRYTMSMS